MIVKKKYSDSTLQASMMEKIQPLLAAITSESDMRKVEEFWLKAVQYLGKLFGIDKALDDGTMKEVPASDIVIEETYAILREGKKLEDSINDPEIIKKLKKLFRECGIPVGIKSEMVKHAFLKPRGYAGDYSLIEMLYNNNILSRGFGYCADKVFINDDYARAVRSRKNMMKDILADFIKRTPEQSIEILNIACGSSREIKEMFDENAFDGTKRIAFTLVDQDRDALEFSLNALKNSPSGVIYHTKCNSIYDYIKNPESYREILGDKDLVYTIGLADYIPDETLKSLVVFLYSLLKPGGRLIIAHKDSKSFSPLAPDWWCDWTFHLRDEPETINLVTNSGIKGFDISLTREKDSRIIFFIMIEKRSNSCHIWP